MHETVNPKRVDYFLEVDEKGRRYFSLLNNSLNFVYEFVTTFTGIRSKSVKKAIL